MLLYTQKDSKAKKKAHNISGAPVAACTSSKLRPFAISMTTSNTQCFLVISDTVLESSDVGKPTR